MNNPRVLSGFTPTVKQLRAFVAVYQLRKLSAAAGQLFVTQSAISVLLRQMEEGLGAVLFDRTTRALQPTTTAHDMLPIAERILRDIDSLGAGVQDLAGLRRGRVSVAITPTLAEILLPPCIQAFSARHPDVHLVIDDCAPDQFFSRLIGEQADFGIGTPEREGLGVQLQPLLHDHLALVVRKDHPLAKRRRVPWSAIDGMPVTTVRPGYGIRPLIELSAARAGVRLNVTREAAFLATALWMTAAGLEPSIMPAAYVTYARDPNLVAKVLSTPKVSRDISVVVKDGRTLSPAAQQFLAVVRETLGSG